MNEPKMLYCDIDLKRTNIISVLLISGTVSAQDQNIHAQRVHI